MPNPILFDSMQEMASIVASFGLLILLFVLWSVVWKGLALWHAARKGQTGWFMIFLVVNTVGILEIIYLFMVLKLTKKQLFKR